MGPAVGLAESGERFYQGRIDDLTENEVYALACGTARGGRLDPNQIALRLRVNGWYKISAGPDVVLVPCPSHGGAPP